MISGKKFSFSNFQILGKLEIDLGIDLKNVFDKLSIPSELRYFFVKILTHYSRFEACCYNVVSRRIFFDMYLWLHESLLSKRDGILNCWGLKKSCYT